MTSQGANFYIARHESNYHGNGCFKNVYRFDKKFNLVFVGDIQADVVYNKGGFTYDDVPCLNDVKIQELVNNKQNLYDLLPDISPNSILVDNGVDFLKVMAKYKSSDLLVVKPNVGACGRGVEILKKETHLLELPEDLEKGYLIQEFLDSSVGIKGLVEGVHDFRITLVNNRHISTMIREPKQGSLVSNFALGGIMTVLSPKETPDSFVSLAKSIDKKFFEPMAEDRLLAFDFANTEDGIKLIEVNSSVGLDVQDDAEHVEKCHNILAETLIKMARDN